MANNEIVEVEISHDNAVLLLDAAARLHHHVSVVETTGEGVFRVPADVAEAAGLNKEGAKASESKVEKAREGVVEAKPYGDPFAEEAQREASADTITTAQPDKELAERQSATKSGRSRTPAKSTAKKAAPASNQKSE